MTKFRELMERTLKNNAERVDELRKNECIIFQANKLMEEWKKLGGYGSIESNCTNIYGNSKNESQTTMKNFKLLMDEYFFSIPNFEIDSKPQSTWIFTTVIDKTSEARYSVDLGMSSMKGCIKEVKQVKRDSLFREEVSYRCEED